MKKPILLIAGTRPEVIKLAPIVLEATRRRLPVVLGLTGQHGTLSRLAARVFGIKPGFNLSIMREAQTPNGIAAATLTRLSKKLAALDPAVVVVQGDTTSAAAAAWCAFNMHIPVVHIEAGLRSFSNASPFPEEANRKIITQLASLHCAPTPTANENLLREGVERSTIALTGNTVVDALEHIRATFDLNLRGAMATTVRSPFVLVTAHRRESFGKGFERICTAVKRLAAEFPETQFVYPVHLNPNVRKPVNKILGKVANVRLLNPVSYLELLALLRACECVVTDSGGIQEEAPSFGKYCIVLRDVTERTESVAMGYSELVGTDVARIVTAVRKVLRQPNAVLMRKNPYGDGHASQRIVDFLAKFL